MTLKRYFLISLAAFVAVVGAVAYLDVPILPFAIILLVGETLLGLEVEDHKVPQFLAPVFKRPVR